MQLNLTIKNVLCNIHVKKNTDCYYQQTTTNYIDQQQQNEQNALLERNVNDQTLAQDKFCLNTDVLLKKNVKSCILE